MKKELVEFWIRICEATVRRFETMETARLNKSEISFCNVVPCVAVCCRVLQRLCTRTRVGNKLLWWLDTHAFHSHACAYNWLCAHAYQLNFHKRFNPTCACPLRHTHEKNLPPQKVRTASSLARTLTPFHTTHPHPTTHSQPYPTTHSPSHPIMIQPTHPIIHVRTCRCCQDSASRIITLWHTPQICTYACR